MNSVEGELRQLILGERIGRQYESGSPDSLLQALTFLYEHADLRRTMGRRSRRLAEERFDRNKTYPVYVRHLERVAGLPR